ncbi:MAG: hypothetical protein V1743_04940 [Nanoarchaeota archaeon]
MGDSVGEPDKSVAFFKDDITLELLVRQGKTAAVELYTQKWAWPVEVKRFKIGETLLYSYVGELKNTAFVKGIEESDLLLSIHRQITETPAVRQYFSQTKDSALLHELIEVFHSRFSQNLDVLGIIDIPEVSAALNNNLAASPELKKSLALLIANKYKQIFDTDAQVINAYFPKVDKWRALVDPQRIAKRVLKSYAGCSTLKRDLALHPENYTAIFTKLIDLVGRPGFSRLAFFELDRTECDFLVANDHIDLYKPTLEDLYFKDLKPHIEGYGHKTHPNYDDVEELAGEINEQVQTYLANVMGCWFSQGKIGHVLAILDYSGFEENPVLFNASVATKAIGDAIADALERKDMTVLANGFKLPDYLIGDMDENPLTKPFTQAYHCFHNAR